MRASRDTWYSWCVANSLEYRPVPLRPLPVKRIIAMGSLVESVCRFRQSCGLQWGSRKGGVRRGRCGRFEDTLQSIRLRHQRVKPRDLHCSRRELRQIGTCVARSSAPIDHRAKRPASKGADQSRRGPFPDGRVPTRRLAVAAVGAGSCTARFARFAQRRTVWRCAHIGFGCHGMGRCPSARRTPSSRLIPVRISLVQRSEREL